MDLVRRLYEKANRVALSREQIAQALGYAGLNGGSRGRVSALGKFGLVEKAGKGERVSDLALQILYPSDPTQTAQALRTAALRPELFRQLLEDARASDAVLLGKLIQQDFTRAGAQQAIDAFRETCIFADLLTGELPASEDLNAPGSNHPEVPPVTPPTVQLPSAPATATRVYIWGLADDRSAELRIAGRPLDADDIADLKAYLDMTGSQLARQRPASPETDSPTES